DFHIGFSVPEISEVTDGLPVAEVTFRFYIHKVFFRFQECRIEHRTDCQWIMKGTAIHAKSFRTVVPVYFRTLKYKVMVLGAFEPLYRISVHECLQRDIQTDKFKVEACMENGFCCFSICINIEF